MKINQLNALSPIDGRYFKITFKLSKYFSEKALMNTWIWPQLYSIMICRYILQHNRNILQNIKPVKSLWSLVMVLLSISEINTLLKCSSVHSLWYSVWLLTQVSKKGCMNWTSAFLTRPVHSKHCSASPEFTKFAVILLCILHFSQVILPLILQSRQQNSKIQ